MGALVVYESMYGNTRTVAEAIAEGLAGHLEVQVVEVGVAPDAVPVGVDLLVVGGPTHVFGMSRAATRASAAEEAGREVISAGPGLREWLESLRPGGGVLAASFDTHVDKPRVPGSAAVAASRRLRRAGFRVVVAAESFYVHGKLGPLVDGELERARAWGQRLGREVSPAEV